MHHRVRRSYIHVVHYLKWSPLERVMYCTRQFHALPSASLVLPGRAFYETIPLIEGDVSFPACNKGSFMYQNDSIACLRRSSGTVSS